MNATQTATIEPVEQPDPILIRGPRELRWNRATGTYDLVEVTPEMIEETMRREMYCSMFDPCGVM